MLNIPQNVMNVVHALHSAGGTCFLVGGHVRDYYLGIESKDIDIEIHGLTEEATRPVLKRFGKEDLVGASFGIYMIKGMNVDWSLPRTETKTASGHKGFKTLADPNLGIEKALSRRDFTVNAMAISLKNQALIDPFGGKEDLINLKVLRVVQERTFIEDPLRVLRGAQFAARLKLTPFVLDYKIFNSMVEDYYSLPKERVWEELKKLLLKGKKPSMGIDLLHKAGWLAHWPELHMLFYTPQDPRHHPEGNVGIHTMEVVDHAAQIRPSVDEKDRLVFMLACLLHDVGKPSTTHYNLHSGTITSHSHDRAGVEIARRFLERLTNEEGVISKVLELIYNHSFPHWCTTAGGRAFRRLKKRVDVNLLGKVCEADGMVEKCKASYYKGITMCEHVDPKKTIVQGRHLIARGMIPGPEFGKIIAACEEIFLDTNITDPNHLIDKVLQRK